MCLKLESYRFQLFTFLEHTIFCQAGAVGFPQKSLVMTGGDDMSGANDLGSAKKVGAASAELWANTAVSWPHMVLARDAL